MDINWYPGHMTKARRMMQDNLKAVDIVMEIIDARIPAASRNPDFDQLFTNKSRMILLNKSDLAERQTTKQWIDFYENQGIHAISYHATKSGAAKQIVQDINRTMGDEIRRIKEVKGANKTVRAMIVGIPNVGKSTVINSLAPGGAAARSGNKPGVTKGKQLIRITPFLELMDTPGVLWPKLENQTYALHLAITGAVRDEIMDTWQLSMNLIEILKTIAPQNLMDRYKLADLQKDPHDIMREICKKRGFIQSGGEADEERGAKTLITEFRAGKLGTISLEKPETELDR